MNERNNRNIKFWTIFTESYLKKKYVKMNFKSKLKNIENPFPIHPVTKGTSTLMACPTRYFERFFHLFARYFWGCWSSKYWMRVSWSTSTQKLWQDQSVNFNFIYRFNNTFYQQVHFILSLKLCQLSFIWHIRSLCVAFMGAELWQLPWRVVFW